MAESGRNTAQEREEKRMSMLKQILLGAFAVLVIVVFLLFVILVGCVAYETLSSTIEDVKEKHKRRSE
jgi:uncharacterized BrkB/YihY/UPF0761 family membrane protein